MPGRHKFVAVAGCVPICEHCGESKSTLDEWKIDGKLPPCPEADDTAPQAGKYWN
jgi:hypothetical protein